MCDVVLKLTADENARQMLTLLTDYLEDTTKIGECIDRLATEYIVVQNIGDLEMGRYVRWIKDGVLHRGGILVQAGASGPINAVPSIDEDDVHLTNDLVMCKTPNHVMMQFHFDECPCFQKLNLFEQWYLLNGSEESKEKEKDKATSHNNVVLKDRLKKLD